MPSFLMASLLVVTQSLHSQIACTLLSQRKIKDCLQSTKNSAIKTSLPPGISSDLPWGGYGFFLELHITVVKEGYVVGTQKIIP